MEYDSVYVTAWDSAIKDFAEGDYVNFMKKKEFSDILFDEATESCHGHHAYDMAMSVAGKRYTDLLAREDLVDYIRETMETNRDYIIVLSAKARSAWLAKDYRGAGDAIGSFFDLLMGPWDDDWQRIADEDRVEVEV